MTATHAITASCDDTDTVVLWFYTPSLKHRKNRVTPNWQGKQGYYCNCNNSSANRAIIPNNDSRPWGCWQWNAKFIDLCGKKISAGCLICLLKKQRFPLRTVSVGFCSHLSRLRVIGFATWGSVQCSEPPWDDVTCRCVKRQDWLRGRSVWCMVDNRNTEQADSIHRRDEEIMLLQSPTLDQVKWNQRQTRSNLPFLRWMLRRRCCPPSLRERAALLLLGERQHKKVMSDMLHSHHVSLKTWSHVFLLFTARSVRSGLCVCVCGHAASWEAPADSVSSRCWYSK